MVYLTLYDADEVRCEVHDGSACAEIVFEGQGFRVLFADVALAILQAVVSACSDALQKVSETKEESNG